MCRQLHLRGQLPLQEGKMCVLSVARASASPVGVGLVQLQVLCRYIAESGQCT